MNSFQVVVVLRSEAGGRPGSVPVTGETPRKHRKNKPVFAPITRYRDTTHFWIRQQYLLNGDTEWSSLPYAPGHQMVWTLYCRMSGSAVRMGSCSSWLWATSNRSKGSRWRAGKVYTWSV